MLGVGEQTKKNIPKWSSCLDGDSVYEYREVKPRLEYFLWGNIDNVKQGSNENDLCFREIFPALLGVIIAD